jgi:hypothetical protein
MIDDQNDKKQKQNAARARANVCLGETSSAKSSYRRLRQADVFFSECKSKPSATLAPSILAVLEANNRRHWWPP